MHTITLKGLLDRLGLSQSALAAQLHVARSTVNLIVNQGQWPRRLDGRALRDATAAYLLTHGASQPDVDVVVYARPAGAAPGASTPAAGAPPTLAAQAAQPSMEDLSMLLRKHTLTPESKKHFHLVRDPFTDEMLDEADVFVSDQIRYVRAAMRQTSRHGGMLAVIGESGAGKSTLFADLVEWINSAGEPITVIAPYVLGTGGVGRSARPLVADDLIRAVFRALSPTTPVPQNAQRRADVMHTLLEQSNKVGRRHVLVIEEAHDLSTQTIKALKRFYELQAGFRKLLSVILIGQPELEWKLSENNAEVREVVQRMEKIHLPPLDAQIEPYLRHKLTRAQVDYEQVFAAEAGDEIRAQLRITVSDRAAGGRRLTREASLCYPLAVNNLVSAAMNSAARIGSPRVDAALIAAAVRQP